MSKEFAVPPVVFPGGGGGGVPGPPNLQQRRIPTAPFQPQPHATTASSALPFMSFDIGNAASSATIYSGNLPTSSSAASFDEESPFLTS
ncbi:hypothetical protein MLD38_018555 [Melastoma candidum]|uniref:Uncharacterized protein n=1 Tax=Melastoma candidum TaxID=119954 RepID=A0ACB9QW41_9MYRT|nr:hypothetical protein MLD38_018555 [Melastoma candidum]